jgi:AcrR family transcriptional regulator
VNALFQTGERHENGDLRDKRTLTTMRTPRFGVNTFSRMLEVGTPSRRLTAKGKERRRQLIDHAARRFAEQGYHPTSVADLCLGLGVGKGVFYWYFPSKEALFAEILTTAQRDLRRAQQQVIISEPDILRQIEEGIAASMAWYDANRYVLSLFQFAATEDTWTDILRAGEEVAHADVVRLLKRGIEEGILADIDPDLAAHAIIGVTLHLSRVYLADAPEHREMVVRAAAQFCLSGLRG